MYWGYIKNEGYYLSFMLGVMLLFLEKINFIKHIHFDEILDKKRFDS